MTNSEIIARALSRNHAEIPMSPERARKLIRNLLSLPRPDRIARAARNAHIVHLHQHGLANRDIERLLNASTDVVKDVLAEFGPTGGLARPKRGMD